MSRASVTVLVGLRLALLGGLLALGACASTSTVPARLDGAVGPVAWRAEDVGVVTRTVDGKEVDAYRFTLVLKETRGSGITFTRFETTVSDRETFRGTPHVATGTWKLAPNGEWRVTLPYSVACPHMPGSCAVFQMAAPLWQIRFSGRDDQVSRSTFRSPSRSLPPRFGRSSSSRHPLGRRSENAHT